MMAGAPRRTQGPSLLNLMCPPRMMTLSHWSCAHGSECVFLSGVWWLWWWWVEGGGAGIVAPFYCIT